MITDNEWEADAYVKQINYPLIAVECGTECGNATPTPLGVLDCVEWENAITCVNILSNNTFYKFCRYLVCLIWLQGPHCRDSV